MTVLDMDKYNTIDPENPPLPPPARCCIEGVHPDIPNLPRQRIYAEYIAKYRAARDNKLNS